MKNTWHQWKTSKIILSIIYFSFLRLTVTVTFIIIVLILCHFSHLSCSLVFSSSPSSSVPDNHTQSNYTQRKKKIYNLSINKANRFWVENITSGPWDTSVVEILLAFPIVADSWAGYHLPYQSSLNKVCGTIVTCHEQTSLMLIIKLIWTILENLRTNFFSFSPTKKSLKSPLRNSF